MQQLEHRAPVSTNAGLPILQRGVPVTWRGHALEIVRAGGVISGGTVWVVGPGRLPIAVLTRSTIAPTDALPLTGDDLAEIERIARQALTA